MAEVMVNIKESKSSCGWGPFNISKSAIRVPTRNITLVTYVFAVHQWHRR